MKGPIDWFARNSVAANLLMLLIMAGGLFTVATIKREVFPEFSLDMITVQVSYRGAAPEEVEEGVCVRVEEAIQGVDGIKRVTSIASEGSGMVQIELEAGADVRKVLDDIKSRVDAIETFPEETEKPIIQEVTNRQQVINVAVHGQVDEVSLKALVERVRDDLSALPDITQVELANARPYEISIEVSETQLRRHGLTFDGRRGGRAPFFTGPAGRFGQDRGRRVPPAHEGPGLPRTRVRETGAAHQDRRHAPDLGRRGDRRGRLRGYRPILSVRGRSGAGRLRVSHRRAERDHGV